MGAHHFLYLFILGICGTIFSTVDGGPSTTKTYNNFMNFKMCQLIILKMLIKSKMQVYMLKSVHTCTIACCVLKKKRP
jgi:hypothetical protein